MIALHRLACCFVIAALVPFLVPLPAHATGLNLPDHARQLSNRVSPLDSHALATGPFYAGIVPVRIFEGRVERQSWRLDGAAATTLQILAPLRDQISAAGYAIVYECRDLDCGGFDFRFGIEVIPAPDMQVDIRNFRYLAAIRGDDEALVLLVSRAGNSGYIQVIHTSAQDQQSLEISLQSDPASQAQPDGLAVTLKADGHVILYNLSFATGAARMEGGPFTALTQLAGFLRANPSYRIALVGHTDSVGSLDSNIALSRRRARAVRVRMTEHYAIAPDRIEAEGMGYLAPVASNLTAEGRKANRRVEAILLSD